MSKKCAFYKFFGREIVQININGWQVSGTRVSPGLHSGTVDDALVQG